MILRSVVASTVLALAACASEPEADPEDDVWVTLTGVGNGLEGGASCVLCSYISQLVFLDPDGTTVEWRMQSSPGGLSWSAPVRSGGSVIITIESRSSPTCSSSETKRALNVEPGDHLVGGDFARIGSMNNCNPL